MAQHERRSLRRMGGAAVAVGLALCVVPATAEASPTRTVCVPFHATGAGQDRGGGQTDGTLSIGRHQIGTTTASFDLDLGTGSVATFTGPLVFVPDRVPGSSIVAQLDGTFDTTTGSFAAQSSALTGSGALRRVSGTLRVDGVEGSDGSFTETLSGRLCVPAGDRHVLARAVH